MRTIALAVAAIIAAAAVIFSVVTGARGVISYERTSQAHAIAAIDGQRVGGAQ